MRRTGTPHHRKILVIRAQYARLTTFRRLQYIHIVCIAQERGAVLWIENYDLSHALQELRILQEVGFRKPVEVLKMRIAKHLHNFDDHLI